MLLIITSLEKSLYCVDLLLCLKVRKRFMEEKLSRFLEDFYNE